MELKSLLFRIPLSLRYGIVVAAGLILLKTLEYQLFSYRFNFELYIGLLALFFMLVGLAAGVGWLNRYPQSSSNRSSPRSGSVNEEEPTVVLTMKEQSLLKDLAEGLSNQQLADKHHLSINTIKTHLKNIYRKLAVNNRAEAVARARRMAVDSDGQMA